MDILSCPFVIDDVKYLWVLFAIAVDNIQFVFMKISLASWVFAWTLKNINWILRPNLEMFKIIMPAVLRDLDKISKTVYVM